ncbi:MAG: hypothetical protein MI976_26820 [Pseudomonadales bacterium]|nr:hypothetical protein [Pseudomonadales bacterium]
MSTNLSKLTTAIKNISSISSLNLLGLILGFALNLFIANKFGAGVNTDALFVAISIPNLFIYLSGLDSIKGICRTFIIDYKNDSERLETFIGNILSPFFFVSLIIFILCVIFSGSLASLIAPGADEATITTIGYYVKILSLCILLTGVTNLFISILNAFDLFSHAASVMFIQKLVIFLSVLFFDIFGLASVPIAYSAGSLLAFFFSLYSINKLNIKLRFSTPKISHDLQSFFKLFKPIFFSVLVMQATNIAYITYCSLLETGIITTFNYAKTLASVVIPLTATPILTVALNNFRTTHDKPSLFRESILSYYFVIMAICVCLCTCLYNISDLVIDVIFVRGNFNENAARLTADFYQTFLISIILQTFCLYCNYVALARQNTTIILTSNALALVGIVICFFVSEEKSTPAIHRALVMSWALAACSYVAYLYHSVNNILPKLIAISLMIVSPGIAIIKLDINLNIEHSLLSAIVTASANGILYIAIIAIFYIICKRFKILN